MEEENKNKKSAEVGNVSQKVFGEIKNKNIKPKPKWEFLVKDYFLWFLGIFSLVIGAFAFSVVLYMFENNDWDVYRNISGSFLEFALATLPYFWIVCLAGFILAARYNFLHTKKGYRRHLYLMIIGGVALSMALGACLHSIGAGQLIDDSLSENAPFYNSLINKRKTMWARPEKGLLAGAVIYGDSYQHFWIRDFGGKDWSIDGEGAVVMPRTVIEKNTKVRIIGKKLDGNNFEAHKIAPWTRGKIAPFLLKMKRGKNMEEMKQIKGFQNN